MWQSATAFVVAVPTATAFGLPGAGESLPRQTAEWRSSGEDGGYKHEQLLFQVRIEDLFFEQFRIY